MAESFEVTLSGDQEVPPTGSAATGSGPVTWDGTAQTAAYAITVTGLDFGTLLGLGPLTEDTSDDVVNMHVHNAARGISGAVVFGQITPAQDADDLSIVMNSDGSVTVSGIWETTDPANVSIANFAAALDAATAGSDVPLYFNVHTPAFPVGEIRGQWVAEEVKADDGTGDIDWNALAARVTAYFEATGSWGLISDWLSDTAPDGGGPPELVGSPEPEAPSGNGAAVSDWQI